MIRILLLAIFCAALASAQEIPMQPFVIDHASRTNSPADVSFLLDAPAGRDGFVGIKDGHLVKPGGERLRLWGVNLTGFTRGANLLPPKELAPLWAEELARFGINCVRMHFLDRPGVLTDNSRADTRTNNVRSGSVNNVNNVNVNRDVNVQSTPGLTRRHVQVNTPYRQDRQTREQRNAVVAARTDKRRAGDHLELRHGGEKLDFIASIRAYTVRMEFLEPEDVGIDFADHPGNTGRVMLPVGTNTTMDIVGCHDET